MGVLQWRDDGILPVICPTCQNVFAGSRMAGDRQATLHGVVFGILVGSGRLAPPPARWHDLALGLSLRDATDAGWPFQRGLFQTIDSMKPIVSSHKRWPLAPSPACGGGLGWGRSSASVDMIRTMETLT
jgi:hypothetical protein